MEIHPSI